MGQIQYEQLKKMGNFNMLNVQNINSKYDIISEEDFKIRRLSEFNNFEVVE